MKKLTFGLIITSFLVALVVSGCGPESETPAAGTEDTLTADSHHQGENCLSCHDASLVGESYPTKRFTSGATVYNSLNSSDSYAEGYIIRLLLETNATVDYRLKYGLGNSHMPDILSGSYTAQVVDSNGDVQNSSGINTHDDTRFDCNECHTASGSGGAPGRITHNMATTASVSVSTVSSDSKTEGSALVHTVVMSGASASDETYALSLGGGSATFGDDYSAATFSDNVSNNNNGTLTVPAGITTFTITTPTIDDTIDEDTESYNLAVGGVSAVGTILDNDTAPVVVSVSTVSSDTKTEGISLVHTVTMSGAADSNATYPYTLGGGTADAQDYNASALFSNDVTDNGDGNLSVPKGVTTFTITIQTMDDSVDEDTESYNISVGGISAVGTILDDDTASVSTVSSPTQTEGTSLVHTVVMSGASASSETYSYTLKDNTTDSSDYLAASFSDGVTYNAGTAQITVPAGKTTFTITIATVDDTTDENTESYTLNVGGISALGTILDNDTSPTVVTVSTVSSDTKTEGANLVHTVVMSGASVSAETYSYAITDNTSDSASDYSAPTFSSPVTDNTNGTITVPAGETTFTITIAATDDTLDEDTESYGISVGGVSSLGTILDNDTASVSSISSDAQTEGTSLVHTVVMNCAAATDKTYSYTLDDNSTDSATDYTTVTFSDPIVNNGNVTITVPANETTFTVTISTVDDSIDEDAEKYTLSVGAKSAIGTINDNDTAAVNTVSSDTKIEGASLVHTVVMNAAASTDKTYAYSLTDSTTDSASDYLAASFSDGVTYNSGTAQITVPAGKTTFTITVATIDDTLDEADSEVYNLSVGGVSATGTITDNDTTVIAVSFASDVMPILTGSAEGNCIACHATTSKRTFKVGDAAYTYNNITSNSFINVASPDSSILLIKGNGGDGHNGGDKLTDTNYQTIRDWISQGGLNN
ncbi:hypothetical protein KJ877_02190 [bacterium]|nr:hypothetical protein [bacterium]